MRHHPGVGLVDIGVDPAQYVDPDLDVLPLRFPYLPRGGRRQVAQVAVLNADEIGFAESEVEVKLDQAVQGVACPGSGGSGAPGGGGGGVPPY